MIHATFYHHIQFQVFLMVYKCLTIPNAVTTIGRYAFANCKQFTSITIPNGVTTIEDYLFYQCERLTNVDIPNTVTSIGLNAFGNCYGLTSLTIPSGVTSIGHYAFTLCSHLTSLTCLATTPPAVSSSTFLYSNINQATLYVPAASVSAYQNADYWKNFGNIQAIVSPEPGDVNGDGDFNVSDATLLINYLLEDDLSPNAFANADMNDDGVANISDIIILINRLLNSN